MTPDETETNLLRVRHSDHDVTAFAAKIVAQVADGTPVVVDLPWSERGNVIHIRCHPADGL